MTLPFPLFDRQGHPQALWLVAEPDQARSGAPFKLEVPLLQLAQSESVQPRWLVGL